LQTSRLYSLLSCIYTYNTIDGESLAICFPAVRLAGRCPLTAISHNRSLYLVERSLKLATNIHHVIGNWGSVSKVNGQGHVYKCVDSTMTEAY